MAEEDKEIKVTLDDSTQQQNYHVTTFNLLARVVEELVDSQEVAEDIDARARARAKRMRLKSNIFQAGLWLYNRKQQQKAEEIAVAKQNEAYDMQSDHLVEISEINSGIHDLGDILRGNDLAKAEEAREQKKVLQQIADKETSVNIESPKDKKGILDFLGLFGLTAFATALGAALGSLSVFPGMILGFAKQIGLNFKKLFPKTIKAITGIFTKVTGFFGNLFKGFRGAVGKVFTPIQKFFTGFSERIKGFVKPIIGFMKGFKGGGGVVGKVLTPIQKFFAGFGNLISKFMKPVDGFIRGFKESSKIFLKIGAAIGRIGGKFLLPVTIIMAVFDGIKGFLNGFKQSDGNTILGQVVDGLYGALANIIANLVGVPLDLLKAGVGLILGFFGLDQAKEALASFSFKDTIMSIITGIGDFFQGVVDTFIGLFTNPKETLSNLGNKIANFGNTVNEFIKKVFKALLPRHRPEEGLFSLNNAAVSLTPKFLYDYAGIDKDTGLDIPQPNLVPNTTGAQISQAEAERQNQIDENVKKQNEAVANVMTQISSNNGAKFETVTYNDSGLIDRTSLTFGK